MTSLRYQLAAYGSPMSADYETSYAGDDDNETAVNIMYDSSRAEKGLSQISLKHMHALIHTIQIALTIK